MSNAANEQRAPLTKAAGLSAEAALALRKRLILARSTALRRQISGQVKQLRPSLFAADQVVRGARWLIAHPRMAMGAASALVFAHRRGWLGRSWGWLMKGYTFWQIWRRVSGAVARSAQMPPGDGV